jgi:hypothetical protein
MVYLSTFAKKTSNHKEIPGTALGLSQGSVAAIISALDITLAKKRGRAGSFAGKPPLTLQTTIWFR